MKYHYGWVVVAAGALMGCVAIGALFSLAVFLQPMSEATGWSRTGISGAMTLDFLTMGVAVAQSRLDRIITGQYPPPPVPVGRSPTGPRRTTIAGRDPPDRIDGSAAPRRRRRQ